LTYTRDGIIHSAGKSVLFTRDNQDRITQITDSSGHQIKYQYNAAGDLVASTDATDNTVRYSYNRTHAMTDIQDPLGRQQVRNIYDDSGRLIAQLDAEGNRTNFNHNLEGRQSLVTDRLGRVTQLYYDDRGNVTSLVDPLGNITRSTYDHFGNQLSETDPLDNTTSFKYDNKFNLLEEKDPEGHVVKFTYNDQGQETTLTDAKGNTFEMVYDERGNWIEIRLPLANAKIVNTIEKGLITETRDALGHLTKFTYDKSGNKLTETDALGHTVTYTYDDNGNQLSESHKRTGADGNPTTEITSYKYDKRNRLIQTTDALGNVSKTEYNILGQEVARIDALERRTEYKYDVYSNLTETRYPDGTKENRTFDAEGNLLTSTDVAGQTTRYEYDKLNRQVKVIHSDGSFNQTEYDAAGRVVAQIDEEGYRTEFKYDKAGRRLQTKNALGQITISVYDAAGNLKSQTDANNNTIAYQYDALDRRIKTIYPDNLVKEAFYDLGGRLVSEKDLAGRETQYEYDKVARLTQVIKFLNDKPVQTRFAYDEVGNRLSQIDANQQTTTWTYDKLGRVLSRTLPLGMTETFSYDNKSGNLLSHKDFNAKTTTFSYDANNDRLLSTTYSNGKVESFTYDVDGKRKTQSDPLGTTTYSYDSRNRLVKEVKANQAVLEYGYDKLGNRTLLKFTAPDGTVAEVQYKYDALSRLQKVIAPDGETTYAYDSVGNRGQVNYANGTSTKYGYDQLNRLTSLETRKPDNSLLASYQYTLAPTGHRLQVTEHSGSVVDYSYDDLYRLKEEAITQANGSEVSFSYQYDSVGNLIYSIEDGVHTEYTYDDNDRLKKQGGVEYQYDNNGNTIRIAEEDNVLLYSYDGDNRLIEVVTEENGQTTSTITYAYDADGNRVQTNADGEVTQYVVDSNDSLSQVVAELDKDNQIKVAYLYGDDLVSQYRDNEINYYHYDGLGSTRTLTNPSSEITDSYTYEAFGELLEQTGETDNNYLYTGEQIDPNTGNYYLRARYYNPGSGRFLSMDSFNGNAQEPITLHKYLYGNADPVNMVDPSGYFSLGSFSVGNSVSGILSTMSRVGKVLNFLDFVTNPTGAVTDKLTNKALGTLVLLSRIGNQTPHLLRLFSKKARKGICPFEKKNNSFVAGTLVHTQTGLVAIEDVQIGEQVWSFNEETNEQQWNEVSHLIQRKNISILFDLTVIDNQDNKFIISTTPEHPFFVPELNTYIPIEALAEDTLLQTDNGTLATIDSIQIRYGEFTVYNIGVQWTHNYFVSSSEGGPRVLVHNSGDKLKSCLPSFVVGNRSVAEVVGNTHIKPGTQGMVDKHYVEKYALDMAKSDFDWNNMLSRRGELQPMEFVELPDGTMIILEGHHRFIASQMTNTPIPWNNTRAVVINKRKKWRSKNWNDYVW
jgi:RHS repeat-associated protein